jgi:thiol-disulfide isomerase/thioredoxin
MRRTAFIAALLVVGLAIVPAGQSAELGDYTAKTPTPPLALKDLQGQQHSLEDYRGKVVLVNFWASWCHPCLQEIPELISLSENLADSPFAILAVNVGEEQRKLPAFVKKMDEHMVILMDPESAAFKNWQGIGLPSTFVLDGNGRIHYEAYGPVDWDGDHVVDTLRQLMQLPSAATVLTRE